MSRPLERSRLRPSVVAGLIGIVISSVVFLIEAPTFVAFGISVLATVAWCIWLEENPEKDG